MKTLYIAQGSPWENGYGESFNGSLRDEPLIDEIVYNLAEARELIEACRRHYNTVRPHSGLGYRPPDPKAATPPLPASGPLCSTADRRWRRRRQCTNHLSGPPG